VHVYGTFPGDEVKYAWDIMKASTSISLMWADLTAGYWWLMDTAGYGTPERASGRA
jgi:hypothetical protein